MEPDFNGLDFNAIMKQAKEVQEKIQRAKKDIDDMTVVGSAGAGMVLIEMTGRYDVRKVTISPAAFKGGKEMVEDLVAAAVNDAVRKVEAAARKQMTDLMGTLDLPKDLQLPGGGEGER